MLSRMLPRLISSFFVPLTLAFSLPTGAAEQVSGINRVSFHNPEYNKNFVGNGFLISFKNKLYAVTVKHALLEARSPEMSTVSLDGHISEWQIHPNQAPEQKVVLGALLNASEQEKIDIKILQKDWLVFEVTRNDSNLRPLTIRDTPLKAGETVSAFGCSYANKSSCKQDHYTGTFVETLDNNLRVAMENLKPAELRGLSGSPVLDANHQLVGIVSNILPAKDGNGFDFAPANLNYLREVLEGMEQ